MKDNWCSAFSRRVSYGGEGGVMKTRQHPQPQTQVKTLSVGQENHRMFGPALVAMAVLLISVLMIFSVLPAMAQAAGYSAEEVPVSYTHLRAHETKANLVCRLLLEKKKKKNKTS